ncbi:MAG: 4-hydroxy-tetrahydrodipicolinate reductase [Dehalococcoidia bacterium]|jgi:4-hydroxy-tetrahydrodipicolinate reductase
MAQIRVVVSGTGKMGREILAAVCADADLEPVGVLEKFSAEEYVSLPDGSGLVHLDKDPQALLSRSRPDVIIDFTHADWTPQVVKAALDSGVRMVIGTTGLPEDFLSDLERSCREKGIGAVAASNFAIGAVLMMHLARIASKHLDHAEIIELHHDQKVDAPSGTAIATAQGMIASRGRPFLQAPTQKEMVAGTRGGTLGGIAIHSVRLPGLVAHQEVIFGGTGQTLTIRHDSTGRESFMPGVRLATKEVMNRSELVRGLDKLIGL